MTQAKERNRQDRQEMQSSEATPSASFRNHVPRGLRVGFAIERTLALLAALAVFTSRGRKQLVVFEETRGFCEGDRWAVAVFNGPASSIQHPGSRIQEPGRRYGIKKISPVATPPSASAPRQRGCVQQL